MMGGTPISGKAVLVTHHAAARLTIVGHPLFSGASPDAHVIGVWIP